MKKLICMLLALCMLLSAANVLAFEQVLENGSPKYTKPSDYSNTTLGEIKDTNTAYEFKSPSGYYYTVIPIDTVEVDGEKQYLFISNNYYGKFPDGTGKLESSATKEARAKFIFDPEITTSYAYWLNNGFFDGTKAATAVNDNGGNALDSEIKSYIREHDWYVNGFNREDTDNKYVDKKYNYDYTVKCKVSVLSTDDITKYAKYMKMTLKFSNNGKTANSDTYACILRTFGALDGTSASSFIRRQNPQSGNTANSASDKCGIRPIFYVSEDYFKEVKLDLNTAGSEVRKIIAELDPGIYFPDEKLSLKGIYTLTEDGSKALSANEWTNATKATVADGKITINKSSWIGRYLPQNAKGGVITIEADIVGDDKNGLNFGFMYDTDDAPKYKYPLYLSDTLMGYYSNTSANNAVPYKRLDSSTSDLHHDYFETPFTVKLTVNLATGNCYAMIKGNPAEGYTANVSYSLGTTAVPYIDKDKLFSRVAIWNSKSDSTKVIDNIKITYDPNGNAIKSVNKIGNKKIEITVDDYVDLTNVTKDSICLTANTVTDITKNGSKIIATLKNDLTNGDKCVIVNDMKRNDVGNANYTIIGNSAVFTVAAPTETQISVPVISGELAIGSNVSAVSYVIGKKSEDAKPVQFVIAAYNGDRLIGAKVANVADVNTADELKAEITLSENATEIRAFIWDSNNYPIRAAVSKN